MGITPIFKIHFYLAFVDRFGSGFPTISDVVCSPFSTDSFTTDTFATNGLLLF